MILISGKRMKSYLLDRMIGPDCYVITTDPTTKSAFSRAFWIVDLPIREDQIQLKVSLSLSSIIDKAMMNAIERSVITPIVIVYSNFSRRSFGYIADILESKEIVYSDSNLLTVGVFKE